MATASTSVAQARLRLDSRLRGNDRKGGNDRRCGNDRRYPPACWGSFSCANRSASCAVPHVWSSLDTTFYQHLLVGRRSDSPRQRGGETRQSSLWLYESCTLSYIFLNASSQPLLCKKQTIRVELSSSQTRISVTPRPPAQFLCASRKIHLKASTVASYRTTGDRRPIALAKAQRHPLRRFGVLQVSA